MQQNRFSRVLLCVALSILLHMILGILILLMPEQKKVKREAGARNPRAVQIVRTADRKKADEQKKQQATAEQKADTPTEEKPFAKTSADTPQIRPEQPDYEGKRSTRAASAPDAAHRTTQEHAPAQDGEEKDELVTFDQERQAGDLEHEGKTPDAPTPPAPHIQPPLPPTPPAASPTEGLQNGSDSPTANGQDAEDSHADATKAFSPDDALNGALRLQQQEENSPPQEKEQRAARRGTPDTSGNATQHQQQIPHIFYDPSLADWAQKPGFRTYERRSRSSGRFVLGRGAALNVASTPRGMYEALVYRRVAHFWYIACDEHRGDIIPGTITISLRITKRGQIDSMALIKRSGASISQQSFTFKAIRKASLPPMPAEVQAEVIGNLMELIFEFNFD